MEDKTKIITVCEKLCKVLHSRPLQINSEQVDRTEPAKKGINKEGVLCTVQYELPSIFRPLV